MWWFWNPGKSSAFLQFLKADCISVLMQMWHQWLPCNENPRCWKWLMVNAFNRNVISFGLEVLLALFNPCGVIEAISCATHCTLLADGVDVSIRTLLHAFALATPLAPKSDSCELRGLRCTVGSCVWACDVPRLAVLLLPMRREREKSMVRVSAMSASLIDFCWSLFCRVHARELDSRIRLT